MALELPWGKIGWLLANADYSVTGQFCFVKATSAGGVSVCGAGDQSIGVLQNTPLSAEAADVMAEGVSKVIYGATVAVGDALMSDASGHAVPQSGGGAVIAVALAAGASGELHEVLISRVGTSGLSANYSIMSLPIKLAQLSNADVMTNLTPGFAGQILSAQFVVTVPVTTAAKAATLNLEIGNPGTDVTGGIIALTSANCTPLGKVNAGTTITAGNTFSNTDVISVEASSVTTFIEGEGVLMLVLKSAP